MAAGHAGSSETGKYPHSRPPAIITPRRQDWRGDARGSTLRSGLRPPCGPPPEHRSHPDCRPRRVVIDALQRSHSSRPERLKTLEIRDGRWELLPSRNSQPGRMLASAKKRWRRSPRPRRRQGGVDSPRPTRSRRGARGMGPGLRSRCTTSPGCPQSHLNFLISRSSKRARLVPLSSELVG